MERINYKDILTAIDSKSQDKNFWRSCKEIGDTIGFTTNETAKKDWRIKLMQFTWNFIMEETFLSLAKDTKEFQGIQYIQPETHFYYHKGNGNTMPDFIIPAKGKTVEVKKFKSLETLNQKLREGKDRWHYADYRIGYIKDEKTFYDVDRMIPLFKNIPIPYIYIDDIPKEV